MIRLIHAIRRKPGMDLAEFNTHWRDRHGPLVASHQFRLSMLRYVQTHRDVAGEALADSFRAVRGGMEPPYDGVAETWWSSEATLETALTSEAGRQAMAELLGDEASFIDLANSPLWLAHEYPQVSTSRDRMVARPKTGVVKLLYLIREKPGMSAEVAQLYWRTEHGPLVRSHAVARGVLCYQQVHRCDSALTNRLRATRGSKVDPYLGHAEAWIDRLSPRSGGEADAAANAAMADEHNFINWKRSTAWLGKELVFVDRDYD